jgi:HSP20 family protein
MMAICDEKETLMAIKSLLPSLWGHGEVAESKMGDPFQSLQHEIDKVFDEFSRGFRLPRMFDGSVRGGPRIDVSESEEQIQVTAELPGVEEKDVEVVLADNVLTIKGEKKSEKEDKKKDYHMVERSYGSFQRMIPVPYDIDPDQVDASFANGVLTVTLAKPPEAIQKTKKIEIKSAA